MPPPAPEPTMMASYVVCDLGLPWITGASWGRSTWENLRTVNPHGEPARRTRTKEHPAPYCAADETIASCHRTLNGGSDDTDEAGSPDRPRARPHPHAQPPAAVLRGAVRLLPGL